VCVCVCVVLTVVVVDYLEVLDRRLSDAAVEVQHVGLGVVVPHGRLVVQLDQVVQRVALPPAQEALLLLKHKPRPHVLPFVVVVFPEEEGGGGGRQTHALRPHGDPFEVHAHAGDDHGHLARPFEAQHVGLLPSGTEESVTMFLTWRLGMYAVGAVFVFVFFTRPSLT